MKPMKLNIQMFATPDPPLQADCHFRFINVSNPPAQTDITFYRETDSTIVTVDFTNGEFEGKCSIGFPIKKIIVGDGTLYSATWVENLRETLDVYIYPKNTITGKILGDNVDNITAYSTYSSVSNNNRPNFSNAATTDEGMFADFDNDGVTTYFRGAVANNYVKFADFWWRIIRVNGNGSIRLIYDGTTAHANGESSTDRHIGTSAFNTNNNNNAYVGYMYGTPGSTTYEATHANVNNSAVKTTLDNWYESNLSNYSDYIDTEAGFWGDRTPYSGSGTGTTATNYAAYNRLVSNKQPSFECTNSSDLYTTSGSSQGNKALTYPIGLISADEVAFVGGVFGTNNTSYYLYTNSAYWTMSPFWFGSGWAFVFRVPSDGRLNNDWVYLEYGVRPVINLRGDLSVTGTGTSTDPYEVSLPVVPITIFNGTELTNIYYNGTEISKMYCNGVLVFEKGPAVYKRRIMVDDNLKDKTIFINPVTDNVYQFLRDYIDNNPDTFYLSIITVENEALDPSYQKGGYCAILTYDTTGIEVNYEFYNGLLHPVNFLGGDNENNMIVNTNVEIPFNDNLSVVSDINDVNPVYRWLYIEDSNIRPIQEGDVITKNTKIYFTWPDNLNPTNGAGQTDAIINFNVVFHIVYNYDRFNKKFNIEAVSWLSSEEKVVLFDQELDINKSYLDLNEFVEGATISGTISFEGGTLPIEVLNGFLVDTTTLG